MKKVISEKSGIDLEIVKEAYSNTREAIDKYKKGLVEWQVYWKALCKNLGKELDEQIFFESIDQWDVFEDIFPLIEKLKEKYIIGMITDNSKERFENIKEKMELEKYFSVFVVSAYACSTKTEKPIFDFALKKAGCSPEEFVFIDNKEKNLVVSGKMGINSIHFQAAKGNLNELIEKLKEKGVEID